MNRRNFIQTSSLVSAGLLMKPSIAFSPMKKDLIGIQLWTVRDKMKDSPEETLTEISRIGYNNIEAYGYDGKFFGMEPKKFKGIIEELGMSLTGTHTGINKENADEYIKYAADLGLEYMVLPTPGGRPLENEEDCKVFAEEMNNIGEKCARSGMKLGYHNHAMEFKKAGDKVLYDFMLEYTDPDLVCFQLDIYWIVKAGYNPIKYFEKFPGRFELWHVKDMAETDETTIVGDGTIDYHKVFKYAKDSGLKYFYVEQEDYIESPIVDIGKSFEYLTKKILR